MADSSLKLHFLAETVIAEAEHLKVTDARLFALPMTRERGLDLLR